MNRLSFWKMSGSGNDFILVDNRKGQVPGSSGAELARALCARRFSVGADGLILIQKSSCADFSWSFYNADGSEAAMCGNGGRCAARFAFRRKIAPAVMSFETGAGMIRAEVRGERVKLQLPDPYGYRERVTLKVGSDKVGLGFLVVGVPHAAISVEDIAKAPVLKRGRAVRLHREFAPEGTNVNFFQVLGPRKISVRTYERGVEGETLACGTGSVAAALTAAAAGLVRGPVEVHTRGGEVLKVYCRRRGSDFREVYLEGAADFVYEGRIDDSGVLPEEGDGRVP
jgi:diaminopimelate epimerase